MVPVADGYCLLSALPLSPVTSMNDQTARDRLIREIELLKSNDPTVQEMSTVGRERFFSDDDVLSQVVDALGRSTFLSEIDLVIPINLSQERVQDVCEAIVKSKSMREVSLYCLYGQHSPPINDVFLRKLSASSTMTTLSLARFDLSSNVHAFSQLLVTTPNLKHLKLEALRDMPKSSYEIVSSGLKRNTTLITVSLHDSLAALVDSMSLGLTGHSRLKAFFFDLHWVRYQRPTPGSSTLQNFLAETPLERLCIASWATFPVCPLTEGLSTSKSVKVLKLERCRFSCQDARLFADLLRDLPLLRELHLDRVKFDGNGFQLLANALASSELASLHVSTLGSELEDYAEGIRQLLLHTNCLRQLTISDFRALGTIDGLIDAIVSNETLTDIQICNAENLFSGRLSQALVEKFAKIQRLSLRAVCPQLDQLATVTNIVKCGICTDLDLSHNIVGDVGAFHLSQCIGKGIRRLILNNTGVSEIGAVRLFDALKLDCNIEELSLAGNTIGGKALLKLASRLPHLSRLEKLSFQWDDSMENAKTEFLKAARLNASLTTVKIHGDAPNGPFQRQLLMYTERNLFGSVAKKLQSDQSHTSLTAISLSWLSTLNRESILYTFLHQQSSLLDRRKTADACSSNE